MNPKYLKLFFIGITVAVFAFMVAPIVLVVIQSFNARESAGLEISDLTLRWYAGIGDNPQVVQSVKISILLAVTSAIAATLVGTAASYGLTRGRVGNPDGLQMFLILPMLVPHIIIGVGLLLTFRILGLEKSFALLFIGHVAMTLPYVILTTRHAFDAIDHRILEAAGSLGASPATIFRKVVLPIALPSIVAGGLFAFMTSLDEVTATLFWRPPNVETLPTMILSMLQYTVDRSIYALSTLLVLFSVVAPALATLARGSLARFGGRKATQPDAAGGQA